MIIHSRDGRPVYSGLSESVPDPEDRHIPAYRNQFRILKTGQHRPLDKLMERQKKHSALRLFDRKQIK
jgi:hypothetical protein